MIKAISYWSLKGGLEGTRPVNEALEEAKAAGFAGLELAVAESGVLTPSTDKATCEAYRKSAEDKGVVVETLASGMSWGCSPTDLDEATRKRSVELHAAALERAAWLGAKAMLFVPGAVTIPWEKGYGPVPYGKAVEWAKEAVARLAETAEKVGVDLCVENVWNGLFYSPMELASFVDGIGSSRVGIYFDAANVLGYHQHPPDWTTALGKRIKRVHVKDFKKEVGNLSGFCDLCEGDMPWKEFMGALREVGYDSTMVAEMMPPDDTLLERTSKAMDDILAM